MDNLDKKTYQHKNLASGGWEMLPLNVQMGNIGSEVSRAIKWKDKNNERALKSINRALELTDLTVVSLVKNKRFGSLKEICRGREVLCDYFYGDNVYVSNPQSLQRYYDRFANMKKRGDSNYNG